MANPVALDLGPAKTLLAFGERAIKHGLVIPGDLQQFIDDPEKMDHLVKYVKAGAPFYQAVLPDIDWLETHKALGLEDEYRAGIKGLVVPERPDIWIEPMVRGVTSNKIVRGHKKLGVKYIRMEFGVPGLRAEKEAYDYECHLMQNEKVNSDYPPFNGTERFRNAAASFFKAFTNVEVPATSVVATCGAQ